MQSEEMRGVGVGAKRRLKVTQTLTLIILEGILKSIIYLEEKKIINLFKPTLVFVLYSVFNDRIR
jgi:hypothetical protein